MLECQEHGHGHRWHAEEKVVQPRWQNRHKEEDSGSIAERRDQRRIEQRQQNRTPSRIVRSDRQDVRKERQKK